MKTASFRWLSSASVEEPALVVQLKLCCGNEEEIHSFDINILSCKIKMAWPIQIAGSA